MLRGFFLGSISGLALAAAGLSIISLVAPQPAGNRPPETPQSELTGSAPDAAATETAAAPEVAATGPEADPEAAAPSGPRLNPPGPAAGALTGLETASAAAPELTGEEPALAQPGDSGAPPAAPAPGPAARPSAAEPAAPQPPRAEEAAAVSPETPAATPDPGRANPDLAETAAEPAAPETPVPAPAAPVAQPAIAADAPAAGAPPPGPVETDAPAEAGEASAPAPDIAAAPADLNVPAPTPEAASAPAADTSPSTAAAPADLAAPAAPEDDLASAVAAALRAAEPAPEPAAIAERPTDEVAPNPETPAAAPPAAPARPQIGGAAAAALPGRETGIRVNRPPAGADGAAVAEAPAAAAAAAGPALSRFAAPFDNPEGLPLLSILLIDEGGMPAAQTIAASIPFPMTILLGGAQSDQMAAWRDAGFEVAALASLPPGATGGDLDQSFQATFSAIPDAVALVDLGGAIATDRNLAEPAMRRLAAEGRGYAWLSAGLGAVDRAAAEAGTHAAPIMRDLDAEGQDARVIRRFIDQAAFRARQEGAVVLVARLRPETISALTLWGAANRAGQVAIAPLSAVLEGG